MIRKITLISKFMTSQLGKLTIAIYIVTLTAAIHIIIQDLEK